MAMKTKRSVLFITGCLALVLVLSWQQTKTPTGLNLHVQRKREPRHGNKLVSKSTTVLQGGTYANVSRRVPWLSPGHNSSRKAVIQIEDKLRVMIREIREKLVTVNASVTPFNISCTQKSIDGTEDLLCMERPKFDKRLKNPCWQYKDRFECLPYFQVVGMDKCGSTDLFDRIAKHPDVLKNGGSLGKETMWWSWLRYGHWLKRPERKVSFQGYLNCFRPAAKTIQKSPSTEYITGDGTPMDLWDNSGWRSIPQNNGLKEPRYITPHLIRHINPNTKFLVILRDPVERLFSDYFFLGLGKMTTEDFHKHVVYSLKRLHACTRTASLRACLYNRNLHLQITARIHLGFYAIFLQDWFQVFPREQFMIIRTEDFASETAEHIDKVFKFLNLRALPADSMKKIASSNRKYVTKKKKNVGEMKAETRRILEDLYSSFNQHLAALLNNRKFVWK